MTKPKRTKLEQFRLNRDLTYAELGDLIYAVTGCRRSESTWSRICRGGQVPEATTANAIEQFLAQSAGASAR